MSAGVARLSQFERYVGAYVRKVAGMFVCHPAG